MTALDTWGNRLVALISLQDAYVDQLMEIKQLAWAVRNAGGDASLLVSNTLAGIPLPADAMLSYTANLAKLDAGWSALTDIGSRLPSSPCLWLRSTRPNGNISAAAIPSSEPGFSRR